MPKVSLDHIGIAVKLLPEMKKLFELLGMRVDHSENVPDQGVNTHFIPLPLKSSSIELLEVSDPEGTVARFIEKRGPGIHHLSFNVESGYLDSLSEKLKAAGYRMVYPEPKLGAHSMRINFIHPATTGGVLIELMESVNGGVQ